MLPVCGLLFVGAPFILHVFGDGYAHAATPLLRWFAVGALLRVVMETYFAVLRAQSRTSGLAYLQGLLCVLVLGLTLFLLPRMGLTGAGVAEISSLAVIVTIAAPRLFRIVRTAPPVERPEDVAPDGDLADLGAPEAPATGPREQRRGPSWSLDSDTLALGVHVDFDHQERRPDVRPGPGTPPSGTPAVRRPTWALRQPSVGLPVEAREPGSEASLGPSETPEAKLPVRGAGLRQRSARHARHTVRRRPGPRYADPRHAGYRRTVRRLARRGADRRRGPTGRRGPAHHRGPPGDRGGDCDRSPGGDRGGDGGRRPTAAR